MSDKPLIGIVGGVGPYAGLDLAGKVLDQTVARADQDHLSMAVLSLPREVEDRTEFILGNALTNPGQALAEIVLKLESTGATVVGMPCHTAHAPPIFNVIVEGLRQAGSGIRLLHMIEETAAFIRENHAQTKTVGILCTTGTYRANVYPDCLENEGLTVLLPNEKLQDAIHAAIYDREYGIKACSNPPTDRARNTLLDGIASLQNDGAQAIILGCTEVPLAISEQKIGNTPIIDPTLILARALIGAVAPEKLKPWDTKSVRCEPHENSG